MTGRVRLQDEGADRKRQDDEDWSKRDEIHSTDVGNERRR